MHYQTNQHNKFCLHKYLRIVKPGARRRDNEKNFSPTQQTPPWKIPTQKILTWNIPTHFINFLSSFNTLFINGGTVYMYIPLPRWKILISPKRLRVFSWNFGNINKIFIQISYICTWSNCHLSIPVIIYQPSFTLKKLVPSFCFKLRWECLMTYEVDGWFLQLDNVTLFQNGFWSIHYILDTWLKCYVCYVEFIYRSNYTIF